MSDSIKTSGDAGSRVAVALVLAASTLASPAWAAEPAPGLRVVKDPVTGALRAPTSEEAAALEGGTKARRQAPRGLLTGKVNPAAVHHPDGTVEQELDESSMSYMVATRNPDGTTAIACVTGPEAAAAAATRKPTAAKKSAPEQTNDR